jgi:acyl transferase domain-containing protein
MTIDTACSGSLISVDLACRYLDSGDADGAIVAGCNLYLNPEHNMEQSAMDAAASRTGRCWTFDARADGYIKAEAINTIILKRLEDAIRDGDPIRAVIRGSSTNSDGWTPGIANPSSDAQAIAIKRAYARAGISQLSETAYLECHGTGTQAGDPIEVTAASMVFAPNRPSPLRIGSVKSNIGHSEPAAGISGMLKTILSLENTLIPGNPTFEVPNPNIDFVKLNVLPSKAATPWPLNTLKRASVNSFGFGGSNAHVVVEHPNVLIPELVSRHISSYLSNEENLFTLEDEETCDRRRLFVLSANDDTSLRALTRLYVRHLANPAVSLEPIDLAYTLSERRTRHFYRAFAISRDNKFSERQFEYGKPRPTPPRIGFVFTGQGAQWSQMGKQLLEDFEIARTTVSRLDRALNDLKNPPPWSLYNELVQRRTTEHMRSPEFSQPLVTALQLAIFDVIAAFGLTPTSVIGHSSGEIAAAAVSGRLTYEEAIKVAYLRGKLSTIDRAQGLGMLAVGLSQENVRLYTSNVPHVQVACINSPASVTLSGKVSDLEQVRENIQADGHFARSLHVDMAYHSGYMEDIARKYLSALRENCPDLGLERTTGTTCQMEFFSTVSGGRIDRQTDAQYWHDNMICPVQFSMAMSDLMTRDISDTLVELGPSGALSGPISQIRDCLKKNKTSIEYFSAFSRGNDSISTLYQFAGRMFLAGADIDLMFVNNIAAMDQPKVVIDLPNYPWNHTVKYWHEPLASIDWRYRKFPVHDLLGTKILGTSWQMPSWRRIIRLKELPWLRDHRISSTVIFPASGYIAMAVEAMYQTGLSVGLLKDINNVSDATYNLRNVRLLRALVLDEDKDHHVYLFLNCTENLESSWYHFNIQLFRDGTWTEHADGMVRMRSAAQPQLGATNALSSFEHPIDSKIWYQALDKVGFNFGPTFQNVLEYETRPGADTNRARLTWPRKEDLVKQSNYSIHPTTLDSFFQAGCPSVYRYRTAIDRAIVPKVIEDITIFSRHAQPLSAIAVNRCKYIGSGRQDSISNRASHAEVFDEHTGQLIFKLASLTYSEMDPPAEFQKAHDYIRMSWMPDVSALHDMPLESLPITINDSKPFSKALSCSKSAGQMLMLTQHKLGLLSLLDVDFETEHAEESAQLHHHKTSEDPTFSRYVYTSTSAQGLERARARMDCEPCSSFFIYNILGDQELPFAINTKFDVVVVRISLGSGEELGSLLVKASSYVADRGFVLLMQSGMPLEDLEPTSTTNRTVANVSWDNENTEAVISSAGWQIHLKSTHFGIASRTFLCSKHVPIGPEARDLPCSILGMSDRYDALQLQALKEVLLRERSPGRIVSIDQAASDPAHDPILLLDHPASPFLETIDELRWSKLQKILGSNRRVFYVSCGLTNGVMLPGASLFTGLARAVRSEDPTVIIKTLELSSPAPTKAIRAISSILRRFRDVNENTEHEYCERKGLLYVSRLYRDDAIIEADHQETNGRMVQKKWLHANPHTVRMKCSRIGTLDSLGFFEVLDAESELRADCIEVEIRAAALNFKDIATSMGLVAEDEYRLGSDGAGIVRRVGAQVTDFAVGDRVITLCRGTFANRVQAEAKRCLMIPSSMSFEVGSSLQK